MSPRARIRAQVSRVPGALPLTRLLLETIRICMRYRVTGLASEAGFFALLSLPPLVLGLFGGVGYIGPLLGPGTVHQVTTAIEQYASRFLTDQSVDTVIMPTMNDVLNNGRLDIISLGFLFSLWSGSRALNVFVDTISIMYGQSGVRGIVRTRTLSFLLYLLALVVGVIVIPLVLIGPSLLSELLPDRVHFLRFLYWPVVVTVALASLTSLFHISTPRRSPWRRDVPGAVFTLLIWLLTSFFLRRSLSATVGGTSIYGPLAAPIVVLIWLYFVALAILIGAALNAAG
jgi:membrane protein